MAHRVLLIRWLLLLLRLCVRKALLIAEQLSLETIILRLQRHDLTSHLLIVHATHVVVFVIGRLEEQVALMPFQPNPQLSFIRKIRTVILLNFVRVHASLHDDTLVDGLLNIVAAERFAGQSNHRGVWSLAPQQVCRPTDVPTRTRNTARRILIKSILQDYSKNLVF